MSMTVGTTMGRTALAALALSLLVPAPGAFAPRGASRAGGSVAALVGGWGGEPGWNDLDAQPAPDEVCAPLRASFAPGPGGEAVVDGPVGQAPRSFVLVARRGATKLRLGDDVVEVGDGGRVVVCFEGGAPTGERGGPSTGDGREGRPADAPLPVQGT